MKNILSNFDFPTPIKKLPEADVPLDGVESYLFQGDTQQIVFMKFTKDVLVPSHSHGSQWAVVLEGTIDLTIDGKEHTFKKGDNYFIPNGVTHSGKIHAGYSDITFFDEPKRYKAKSVSI